MSEIRLLEEPNRPTNSSSLRFFFFVCGTLQILTTFKNLVQNDQKLNILANKLATFRNINQEIGDQAANDSAVLNQISNSFDSLSNNIRNASHRLRRTMQAGNGIWRMVGLALLIFFVLYTVYKLFWSCSVFTVKKKECYDNRFYYIRLILVFHPSQGIILLGYRLGKRPFSPSSLPSPAIWQYKMCGGSQ